MENKANLKKGLSMTNKLCLGIQRHAAGKGSENRIRALFYLK